MRVLHGAGLTFPARTVLTLMLIATSALFLLVMVGGMAAGYALTAGMLVMALAFAGALGIALPMMVLTRLRSEEHTSELQSLMRISYAVFCLKKKKKKQ